MTLSKFPLFVEPNVILDGPTKGLSIRRYLTFYWDYFVIFKGQDDAFDGAFQTSTHRAAADGDVQQLVAAIKLDPGSLQQKDHDGINFDRDVDSKSPTKWF